MDEIEDVLQIECAPITWPVGMGREFRGCYHLLEDRLIATKQVMGIGYMNMKHSGANSLAAKDWLGEEHEPFAEQIELVKGASHEFKLQDFLEGRRSPGIFWYGAWQLRRSTHVGNVRRYRPHTRIPPGNVRTVEPSEDKFTGFVFKIQANMDPVIEIDSVYEGLLGSLSTWHAMNHVRVGRQTKITDAVTFMAGDRLKVVEAYAGDIIGLHNHGSIQIGDSFSEGEPIVF
ncbi:MAG: hypothetical protein Ct9H300mP8_01980 [Gammaproteobacteria bacterium]|nr:MAG: hypothetical protein Ct9H300mP8_01980 [Gammaproteobacteria bacterium]